ncbi:hypothetical protein [Streptococcus pneumoniae]|nr:hypothetical protein [Streptococcus pneumoniae]
MRLQIELATSAQNIRFEVADRTGDVSNTTYGKATLTWVEEIFEE